jgi:hypothetical protein
VLAIGFCLLSGGATGRWAYRVSWQVLLSRYMDGRVGLVGLLGERGCRQEVDAAEAS